MIIFGTDVGLFSLHDGNCPVQIFGVAHVHNILLAPQINLVLLIVGEGRRLVLTDYRYLFFNLGYFNPKLLIIFFRLMISNANAAKCANPGIITDIVPLGDEEPVSCIAIANKSDNHLAAATTKNLQ